MFELFVVLILIYGAMGIHEIAAELHTLRKELGE